MARFKEPTAKQKRGWAKWVESRPPNVRAVAERFDPWSLYRMGSNRVTVQSFGEDKDGRVTLTVGVSGDFNAVIFERSVFGVDPESLTPCELPTEGEPLGAVLSNAGVDANIDGLRAAIAPELWVMGDDGKARRRS